MIFRISRPNLIISLLAEPKFLKPYPPSPKLRESPISDDDDDIDSALPEVGKSPTAMGII